MKIFIAYEINLWTFRQGTDFTLGNSFFETVKFTKNVDFNKYKYSVHGIGFDALGCFSLFDGSGLGKNVIIIGADMSSSEHIDSNARSQLKG